MLLDINAPYEVYYDEESKLFEFTTDDFVQYKVYLVEMGDNISLPIYSVGLSPIKDKVSLIKGKVEETTCKIIKHVLDDDLIICYTCETNDNRQECRHRLFKHWLSKHNEENYEMIDFHYEDIYGSLILNKTNQCYTEYKDKIKDELIDLSRQK